MRTPKEYTENLKNGIITENMFSDCIFSANKRAKNYRDNAREQRREYGRYASTDRNDKEKEKYYREKDFLLSFLEPVCIHKEPAGFERIRVYDYQKDYRKHRKDFIWENCYYDDDYCREVWFGDYYNNDHPYFRWYLYYEIGAHSFHHPIEEGDIRYYPELEVKGINTLDTHGMDTCNLLSTQFVNKVMLALCNGTLRLDFEGCRDPLPGAKQIPDFVIMPKVEKKRILPEKEITTVYDWDKEVSVVDYITRLAHEYSGKEYFLKTAEKYGMNLKSRTTMSEAIEFLRSFKDDEIFYKAADDLGIGVEKRSYIKAGMSESEYKRLSKQMTVVRKRKTNGRYKNVVNEYSLRQYMQWCNTGEIEAVSSKAR